MSGVEVLPNYDKKDDEHYATFSLHILKTFRPEMLEMRGKSQSEQLLGDMNLNTKKESSLKVTEDHQRST